MTARRRIRTRTLAVLAVVAVVLSGCAGVPSSSTPEIVGPVGGPPLTSTAASGPAPNIDPRTLVTGFVNANADPTQGHPSARQYLTADANSTWSDSSVTVLATWQVSTFDSLHSTVTVSGDKVGKIDSRGIYTPSTVGQGNDGDPVSFTFAIKLSHDQWRIDNLADGLIVNLKTFQRAGGYTQRAVYFLDQSEQRLVPDPRWSALTDLAPASDLLNWLVAGLAGGPSDALQTAVVSAVPNGTTPSVTYGNVISVTMPGSAQLDGITRYRLAAQVAATFALVTGSTPIRLLDGSHALVIPNYSDSQFSAGNTQFSASDFATQLFPAAASAALYYVAGGGVHDANGAPLPGAIGGDGYGLSSVALAPRGADDLLVAGVAGTGSDKRLLMGTRSEGLLQQVAGVTGDLTRPSWAAAPLNELWVGDGSILYRIYNGVVSKVSVTPTSGAQLSHIIAVRISPDGSRIAMVLAGQGGTAQLWIGSIVRAGRQIRIDSLAAISPSGIALIDVSWNDSLKLFVTGRSIANDEANVYEIQVDGSAWNPRFVTNLPGPPESITVSELANAWVSAGDAVWTQSANEWVSPRPDGKEVAGENPVYVE